MKRWRNQQLDNLSEEISSIRGKMAALRSDEADAMRASLAILIKNGKTSYNYAGVEMVVTEGERKLRVRTKKDSPATEGAEVEVEVEVEAQTPGDDYDEAADEDQGGGDDGPEPGDGGELELP